MTAPSHNPSTQPLLSATEPAPVRIVNAHSASPILLNCEHASRRIPASLGTMGLDPIALRCHLAVDIGAGKLTETLAERLGVTAVLVNYSRLVVDCNRDLQDPSAFVEFGDGIAVPGNCNLTQPQKDARSAAIYTPYHAALDAEIERLSRLGAAPVFISLHSFTPVMNGHSRPWHMGVLWDKDTQTRDLFLNGLRTAGYRVGSNEPYSGKDLADYTIDSHPEALGLPHVGIEVRHDLIDDDAGVAEVAAVMAGIIESLTERLRSA